MYQNLSKGIGLKIKKVKKRYPILKLTKKDFDEDGNFTFTEGSVQERGGLLYYQPSAPWKRIGLNVSNKYDDGNDDWLMMNGNPREWAVAFHGITITQSSAIQGVINRGLQAGTRQAYAN